MPFYKVKPVIVEAVQFTGDTAKVTEAFGELLAPFPVRIDYASPKHPVLIIESPSGEQRIERGHWVVKWDNGALTDCHESLFLNAYEPVMAIN